MSPAAATSERHWLASVVVISIVLVLLSKTVTIGADALWLVAMGDAIAREGGIPIGVPFAAADSSQWVNVPVVGELLFAGLHGLGPLGLPALQLVVNAAFLVLLGVGARRLGAGDRATAAALFVAAMGMLPALGVVRAQLLSLVPFALLLLLLRSEHARPSRRIWLLVPLVALWGNLHGAVLAGVAVAGCYLLFSRLSVEPLTAVPVGLATLGALWITPGHLRTADYYLGVLGNEAAQRGSELWAAPRLDAPFDVLMMVAALILLGLTLTARRAPWEYVALAGLVVATVTSARHGLWLVAFCAAPAAFMLSRVGAERAGPELPAATSRTRLTPFVAATMAVTAGGMLWSRAPAFEENALVVAAVKEAAGREQIVLAPEPLVEALAASGVRVWASNPIDAFSREDQGAYLDFLTGAGRSDSRALSTSEIVVAKIGSPAALLAARAGFVVTGQSGEYALMRRP